MTGKTPMRIPLTSNIKQLRVERAKWVTADKENSWRIWLTANGDFTLGTFIELCDSGTVNRVTWYNDGTEHIFNIKQEE